MLPIAERGLGCCSLHGETNASEPVIEVFDVAEFPATGRGLVVEETGEMRVPRGSCDRGINVPLESVDS